MKCDKHGIEMEWRGSLMKGGMYCVCCDAGAPAVAKGTAIHEALADAIASGTGVMGIDPGGLQGSFSPDQISFGSDGPLKQPMRARYVGFSMSRVSTRDHMQAQLQSGASSSYCPYCDEYVGPEHLQALPGTQAALCHGEYQRDLQIVRRPRP